MHTFHVSVRGSCLSLSPDMRSYHARNPLLSASDSCTLSVFLSSLVLPADCVWRRWWARLPGRRSSVGLDTGREFAASLRTDPGFGAPALSQCMNGVSSQGISLACPLRQNMEQDACYLGFSETSPAPPLVTRVGLLLPVRRFSAFCCQGSPSAFQN